MKSDLYIIHDIVIPEHELDLSTSRSGGPGGQHVNKTNSRVTVRWNLFQTRSLTDEQKDRVVQKLQSSLTTEGDLIIHASSHRSQEQNKRHAFERLADIVRRALMVPKKRMKTRPTKAAKEVRLHRKFVRSTLKKTRSNKNFEED